MGGRLYREARAGKEGAEHIVTACIFCNVPDNRTSFDVEGNTPVQLAARMKPTALECRGYYKKF